MREISRQQCQTGREYNRTPCHVQHRQRSPKRTTLRAACHATYHPGDGLGQTEVLCQGGAHHHYQSQQ